MMKKSFILGACAVAMSISATGVLAEDYWLETQSGCHAWSDKGPQEGEVLNWTGACVDGRLNGVGHLTVIDDGKLTLEFEGMMSGGKANAPGRMIATTHEGKFSYQGGFRDSLFEGYGIIRTEDGSSYQGGFRQDKPHGEGVYHDADGSFYQGSLKAGVPDGWGYEILPTGERYRGWFREGKRDGNGQLVFADGEVYEGGFHADLANGQGRYMSLNGVEYLGTWREGKADGEFMLVMPDGSREQQLWKSDERVH